MGILVFFWILGTIFLVIEYWYLIHLYREEGTHSKGYTWKRLPFKVFHLLLLVIANITPGLNFIIFVLLLCIPAIEDDIYFKLTPPGEEKENSKLSKLDKLLNKEL